ncbi:glycosyltransferase family 39 protein [Patescibacteria group bacterium]|nr:glycosyltransferase family 39 protein [Patescibacteria group bacterium]MBU1868206.1 glycosyltransferase family 39 protein [Patescibacteria group bacterium]
MSKQKTIIVLIGLFLFALILRAIFLYSTPIRIWDEAVYANLGYDLSKNPLNYSLRNTDWSDFIPSGGDEFYSWPKIGFRAPLLPYLLAVFYFLKLDFMIYWIIPLVGALSAILVYILGKSLFNEKVGLYSALLFSVVPLHVIFSANILTGVLFTFFVLLTFICFVKGYEENNTVYRVLFGLFLGLALLSRYTALWVMPIFPLYFLAKHRSLKFLKDIHLWHAVIVFFLVLHPWFYYGMKEYGNPIGPFIHGFKAADYWGDTQPWYFFFQHWWYAFSLIGFIFPLGLIYALIKRDFLKKELYLLLIWITFFLGLAIYMPHKEMRIVLAVIPAVCIVTGYFIDKLPKFKNLLLVVIILTCGFSLYQHYQEIYQDSYTGTNLCYLEGNEFLKSVEPDSLIVTDESAGVYFHSKKKTTFYPSPWSLPALDKKIAKYDSAGPVYVFFTDFNMSLVNDEYQEMRSELEEEYPRVFECVKGKGYSAVYRYK